MVLCRLYVMSVSVMFHLTYVQIIFSSVKVAERPPFGKGPLTRLTVYSLCIFSICDFIYFHFWF